MSKPMRIDFVSDVSCPWCVIGLRALEIALGRLDADITGDIHFQPFELNPQMPREGENLVEHLGQKYGTTPAQSAATREMIRARAEAVGFAMRMTDSSRIYNTFDAHRLLHWAKTEGRQAVLKHGLFGAYFSDGADVSDHEILAAAASRAGLDAGRAREILASDEFAIDVRNRQVFYRQQGIHAVPAIIVSEKYLISGGQPVEVFERALKEMARQGH
jgi:predicted DsbA family dithiol-disulfide isomerase